MKRYRLREQMNGIPEPPGKVWFWELEAGVIDADRCIRCGTCVAVCPSNSIGIHEDTDLPELVKMCTGCSLCWDFCPRGGMRYESLWPDESCPSDEGGWKLTGTDGGQGLGQVRRSYSCRVGERIAGVQDGGFVSALLIGLIEAGHIDGALVARPSTTEQWKGEAFVARTPQEVVDSAGSFYNQTMALAHLDLADKGLPD
ncbi:MAG: coenzyme F420 hydrogenase/dehydrogenase beta subunit N-terminal domain-containing protein, partial [Acidimicrobiales bacterium]